MGTGVKTRISGAWASRGLISLVAEVFSGLTSYSGLLRLILLDRMFF